MILQLYAVGILALAIFVNWWFLLGLLLLIVKLPVVWKRARILNVLKVEHQYEFPATAPQAFTLNRLERETRSQKLKAEELATMFMAVMVNSLMSSDQEAKAFTIRVAANAARLAVNGAISDAIYEEFSEVVRKKIGSAL